MRKTPNFGLNLPDGTDKVDISVLNENSGIIDTALASGGGGVTPQSDWNQNDSSKPDYVKNRPCWKEETTVPYYDFTIDRYGATVVDLPGYAPDLSGLVGEQTVRVVITVFENTFDSMCDVVSAGELDPSLSDYYCIAVGARLGEQFELVGYLISGISSTSMGPSDDSSIFYNVNGVTASIRVYLPATQTVYHTLDRGYLPSNDYEDIITIKDFTPAPLANQPTTTSTYEEVRDLIGCGYVYPTDTDHFVILPTASALVDYVNNPSGDVPIWELANLDTGNGYELRDGMPILIKVDYSEETYELWSYADPSYVSADLPLSTANTYDYFKVIYSSYGEMAFKYDSDTDKFVMAAYPTISIHPEYPGDIDAGTTAVMYPNGRCDEGTPYVTSTPQFRIYPPVNIQYNNSQVTITPKVYNCGKLLCNRMNDGYFITSMDYTIVSEITMTGNRMTVSSEFSGSYVGSLDAFMKAQYQPVDLTATPLDYSILSTYGDVKYEISEDCSHQRVFASFSDPRFERPEDDNNLPNKATSISISLGNEGGSSFGQYPQLGSKLIVLGKYRTTE